MNVSSPPSSPHLFLPLVSFSFLLSSFLLYSFAYLQSSDFLQCDHAAGLKHCSKLKVFSGNTAYNFLKSIFAGHPLMTAVSFIDRHLTSVGVHDRFCIRRVVKTTSKCQQTFRTRSKFRCLVALESGCS